MENDWYSAVVKPDTPLVNLLWPSLGGPVPSRERLSLMSSCVSPKGPHQASQNSSRLRRTTPTAPTTDRGHLSQVTTGMWGWVVNLHFLQYTFHIHIQYIPFQKIKDCLLFTLKCPKFGLFQHQKSNGVGKSFSFEKENPSFFPKVIHLSKRFLEYRAKFVTCRRSFWENR